MKRSPFVLLILPLFLLICWVLSSSSILRASDQPQFVPLDPHAYLANDYSDIVYRDRKWTIVGSEGVILNSNDGLAWDRVEGGIESGIRDLSFFRGLWVAVGDNGLILVSRDRELWETRPSPTLKHLTAVGHSHEKWIAVGFEGTMLESLDGRDWVRLEQSPADGDLHSIEFADDLWVAVGDDGVVVRSTDGNEWVLDSLLDDVTETQGSFVHLRKISYGFGRWNAVGFAIRPPHGIHLQSEDGVEWIQSTESLNVPALFDMALDDDGEIRLVGDLGGVVNLISRGRLRSLTNLPLGLEPLRGIAKGGGRWIAVGDLGGIAMSTDGNNWHSVRMPKPETVTSIALGDGVMVAVTDGPFVRRSGNGREWQRHRLPVDFGLTRLHFSQGTWGAVGPAGLVLHSSDARDWTVSESRTRVDLNGIAGSHGRWVAVGESGTIIETDNISDWPPSRVRLDPFAALASLRSVAVHQGTWLAVGSDGTILRSIEPGVWNTIVGRVRGGIHSSWRRVMCVRDQWIVVGSEDCCSALMARSVDDGLTWDRIELDQKDVGVIFDVGADNSMFLAVGRPLIRESRMILGADRRPTFNLLSSTDGMEWQSVRSGVQGSFSAIANLDGRWIIGSDRGQLFEFRIDLPRGPNIINIERSRPGYVVVSLPRTELRRILATRDLSQPFRTVEGTVSSEADIVTIEIPITGESQFFQFAD